MENTERKELLRETGIITGKKTMKSVLFMGWTAIVTSAIVVIVAFVWSTKRVDYATSKMVVIDSNGNSVIGNVSSVNEHELAKLRAENCLRLGVDYMYGFTSSNFDNRISQAKEYWGQARNEIMMSYRNQKVRETVIQNSLTVDVVIEKIEVGYNGNNLVGRVEFEQSFVNGTAVKKRKIIADCVFKSSQPTNENSTGFVIDKWVILNQ